MSSSSYYILCYYLFLINCLIDGVWSLKLTEFLVPDHAELGSTITLTCYFDVDSATLNSVKWYKGEHEFFRFSPSIPEKFVDFPLDGVTLDLKSSDKNMVTLKELTFDSAGQYRCEVSTDAPDFKIAFESKNMTVVAYPTWGPVITEAAPEYSVGQTVTANCSVAPSYPSPALTWEINGRPVEDFDMTEVVVPGPGKLSSSRSTLQFIAEEHHFQGSNQVLSLRCIAKLDRITSSNLETTFTSVLAHSPGSLESALQRYRNTGAVNEVRKNTIITLLTLLLLTRNMMN